MSKPYKFSIKQLLLHLLVILLFWAPFVVVHLSYKSKISSYKNRFKQFLFINASDLLPDKNSVQKKFIFKNQLLSFRIWKKSRGAASQLLCITDIRWNKRSLVRVVADLQIYQGFVIAVGNLDKDSYPEIVWFNVRSPKRYNYIDFFSKQGVFRFRRKKMDNSSASYHDLVKYLYPSVMPDSAWYFFLGLVLSGLYLFVLLLFFIVSLIRAKRCR